MDVDYLVLVLVKMREGLVVDLVRSPSARLDAFDSHVGRGLRKNPYDDVDPHLIENGVPPYLLRGVPVHT